MIPRNQATHLEMPRIIPRQNMLCPPPRPEIPEPVSWISYTNTQKKLPEGCRMFGIIDILFKID